MFSWPLKGYENLHTKCAYFVQKNRERNCAAASEYIFCVEDCVAASRNTSTFFNGRAAASERYQLTTASGRKCAAASEYVFCVSAANVWLLL